MVEGSAGPRRLPFTFDARGGVGRLALADVRVGLLDVQNLVLEVAELGTDPGVLRAERYQRRRTTMRTLAVRVLASALDDRVDAVRQTLAGHGITNLLARLSDGYVSVRARAADGLAAADVSFRASLVSAGTHLRALASHVRVHGHLPTPGPLIADRILTVLLDASAAPDPSSAHERPRVRGLCDVEVDLVGGLLWSLMPPAGWRLPAVREIDLIAVRVSRSAIEVAFGPSGSRVGDLGVRPAAMALAAAHDLMHSADQQLRTGHLDEAMRGYRALLAAGGPEQPLLLERILGLAAARPAWFFDGLELARQALGRWPRFPAAHAALASIMLAQGDAREAAGHLTQLARQASSDGDDDQAALAALAGARLLRVLEPRSATQLYELALEHDPGSAEAADALADRLADEQRWPELVRLLRARAVAATPSRGVELRLRLADVFVHQLADLASAQHELSIARELAPDNPAVHEMTAAMLASTDPPAALEAWREVARLAEARGDARAASRAFAIIGDLLSTRYAAQDEGAWSLAEEAWRRALAIDPLQSEAIAGLATAAATRGEHARAAELYERLRGAGLPQHTAARHELMLARSLVQLGRHDEARGSLRRATLAGGETAAEAHVVLAELAEALRDVDHALAELDVAILSFVGLAGDSDDRLYARAAELAMLRAALLDAAGHEAQAIADWERAYHLAHAHSQEVAGDAARALLARASNAIGERRWIDAVLATRPSDRERAALLVQRADVRSREPAPDLEAALLDLRDALALTSEHDPESTQIRRRALQLEAELLAQTGDLRARAEALGALARLGERAFPRTEDRAAVEVAAAAAWLAAGEPSAALPHGARAHAALSPEVSPELCGEVLTTLGEAAWRQRAWIDVLRAYRTLLEAPDLAPARAGTYRYRLAVAADRSGDPALALGALAPLVAGLAPDADPVAVAVTRATAPDVRGQALRLYADLAERAGQIAGAAAALEGFANVASDSSPSARGDAMYRAGELFRRAERLDDAVRCLEAALTISAPHLPALDALELIWRERGDTERLSVILSRKVATMARHPQRQKPLLSRLGDLQHQLGRPEVAMVTHRRALEIDESWRPSLRYVTERIREQGQLVDAASGFARLVGEVPSDAGVDLAIVARERQVAASALSELVARLDDEQLAAVRDVAASALERAAAELSADVSSGLARLHGLPAQPAGDAREESTPVGRHPQQQVGAMALRDAARRARQSGNLADALASLETADRLEPGDPEVLSELVELASEAGDHAAAARHLAALARQQRGPRQAETLLALAEVYDTHLADPQQARAHARAAAEAFGPGARRDTTLRMVASREASLLAWELAVDAIEALDATRRTMADHVLHATALVRAGRPDAALAAIDAATAAGTFGDGGLLIAALRAEIDRRARLSSTSTGARDAPSQPPEPANDPAAARERLLAAHAAAPDDPRVLELLLATLAESEPSLHAQVLEQVAARGSGRALAIACHELATRARAHHDALRAAALWQRAHRADPDYTPAWMPLADALVAGDELDLARELYERIAASSAFDAQRRTAAAGRAAALGHDDSIVSGEIGGPRPSRADALREVRDAPREDRDPSSPSPRDHDRDATHEQRDVAMAARAATAYAQGDWATADALYRDLEPASGAHASDEIALRRSTIAERLGRPAEALAHAKRAAALAPARHDAALRVHQLATALGELDTAIAAATHALELLPLDAPDLALETRHALVDLHRATGAVAPALAQLERIAKDHPHDQRALAQLAELSLAARDWTSATRCLFQLVALSPNPHDRAERLHRLGEVYLEHVGDLERADDAFLRASDLAPQHVPTLRRLLDVYWRAGDPDALVEVAGELLRADAITIPPVERGAVARAVTAAALCGNTAIARPLLIALGDAASAEVAAALASLDGRTGRITLTSSAAAIASLCEQGLLDAQALRAAAAGTPAEHALRERT